MNDQINRRGFFKVIAGAVGLVAVAPTAINSLFASSASAQEKRRSAPAADAGGAMPMVDVNDATAKAVGYVEDAKKSANSKGNHCSTCGFYTKKETKNGKEVGTCTIFAGKLVYGQGFCNSWNKKA